MKFIVCLLLVSVYVAQGHSLFWDDDFMDDILEPSRMQEKILKNIEKMNEKIHKDIEAEQEKSNAMRTRIENEAKAGGTYTSSSSSSSSSSVNGESRRTFSGKDEEGNIYYRETVEKVINNVLYCTETVRNPTTGVTTVYHYTQDLKDPKAKRVLVKKTRTQTDD